LFLSFLNFIVLSSFILSSPPLLNL
jgi:hypothetical protein